MSRLRANALLVCAAVVLVGSAPGFLRTFITDDASYALIAARLNQGHLLYRDAVDNKPPLIYLTFAAVFRVFGQYNLHAVKLVTAAVLLLTAALVREVGTRLFDRSTGVAAALFFACASVSGIAEDSFAPNTEIYMNLFVLAGLWTLVRGGQTPTSASLLVTGMLVGMAALYRVQALLALPGLCVYLVGKRQTFVRALGGMVLVGAGFLLPVVATGAYFLASGTLGDAWQWVVVDNFFYVGAAAVKGGWTKKLAQIGLTAAFFLPILVLCGVGFARFYRAVPADRGRLWVIVILLLGALATYPIGGRFYGHYLLQAVPFLCLMAAWGYQGGLERSRRTMRLVPPVLAVWCVLSLATNGVRLSASREPAGVSEAAVYLRENTGPADEVFLWAGPPTLLARSQRIAGTRFLNNNPMTGRIWGTARVGPAATPETNRPFERAEAWRLLWDDLGSSPPMIIVDGTVPNFELTRYPRLSQLVVERYQPPVSFGVLRLYRRRDHR